MNIETLLNDLKGAKLQLDSAIEDLEQFIYNKDKHHSYNMNQLQLVFANTADVSAITELSSEELETIDDNMLFDRLKG